MRSVPLAPVLGDVRKVGVGSQAELLTWGLSRIESPEFVRNCSKVVIRTAHSGYSLGRVCGSRVSAWKRSG